MSPFAHHIRIYCERTSYGLLGEPVNTFSNIGFFIAAWLLWRLARNLPAGTNRKFEIVTLIALTVAIGAGSAIFHSVATMGSIFFDVIPIAIFVFFYVFVFSRRILGFSRLASTALFLLLVFVNLLYKDYFIRSVDGYISYIPTFLFLAGLALYMLIIHHPSALRITAATGVAFASLYFRTVDRSWCGALPIGTHFLWHLLNAVVIYIMVRELILILSAAPRHGNP